MILLGAGSSVPFGIPAMRELVKKFKASLRDASLKEFLGQIESALENSERLVGTEITFDLESLMVVLEDLVAPQDRPVSAPTFALMIHLIIQKRMEVGEYNITNARQTFGKRAQKLLDRLRTFIFKSCTRPIEVGREQGSFYFFDVIYSPLFALLGNGDLRSPRTQWIFTTNWDLCLTQWLDYAMRNVPVENGISLGSHGEPVFSPKGWTTGSSNVARKVVPLHGSLGLIRKTKVIQGGTYVEIHIVPTPEIYFKGNPSELANAFMIFPLEVVGYEQSVRSPYLDMLNLLKERLLFEGEIWIIGSSLRDSTIASILEETLRERAQRGDWQPIIRSRKGKYDDRTITRFGQMRLKVFMIDSSPETTIRHLQRQGYLNLASALIPIEITFPKVIEYAKSDLERFKKSIGQVFTDLFNSLKPFGLEMEIGNIQSALNRMNLDIPFPVT